MASEEIPQLHEIAPGLLRWSFYEDTPWRLRLVVFAGLACFGWIVLGLATAQAISEPDAPLHVLVLLPCFLVGWTAVWGFVCFCSVTHEADTDAREFRRVVFWMGKRIYTRTIRVLRGDSIVIYYGRDREHGGSQHRVYLRRDRKHRLLGFFKLKQPDPSDDVLAMVNRLSDHMGIESRGYQPFRQLIWSSLTTFRLRH